ncbi:MAG: metallophosphoesterase [Euzebyaceae bacterium]|nr:metallophosphoesterase [Euzebyaceae bacterium]
MAIGDIPLRIAHLASVHCGDLTFDEKLMGSTIDGINRLRPDLVLFAGDLTTAGYQWEYAEAAGWLDRIDAPKVVVAGNHDSRNVGYVHFEHHFGARFSRYRQAFDPERAERISATGVTVVAADSSEPDLDEGHIGRERYPWIREQFDQPGDFKIFLLHHHLVAVPGAGRELNVLTDAGDLLPILTRLGVDVVASGHKHVPSFWGLNGMLVCNCSTAATRRVRGLIPPSWNELQIDASTIKVYLHYEDGRRQLSVIRSRTTRALVREAFYLTDRFLKSNRLEVG